MRCTRLLALMLTVLAAVVLISGCGVLKKVENAAKDEVKKAVAEVDKEVNGDDSDADTDADADSDADDGNYTDPEPAAPSSLPAGKTKKQRTKEYFQDFEGITIGGSRAKIGSYTVTTNTGDVIKPAVKYRLDGSNNLEIHLWLAYVKYAHADSKPSNVSANSTLAKQYRSGVKSYWTISVNNKTYKYKTKVYFHNGDKDDLEKAASDPSAQQYIAICIGGECPAYAPGECPESVSGNHWYHAHPQGPVGYAGYPSVMYLPTTSQTAKNKTAQKRTHLTGKKFSAACAHETGHILGLADAYAAVDARGTVDRMDENTETAKKTHGIYCNLMKDQNSVKKVLPNDLQMALQAYHSQVKNYAADFMQNYKTYTWYDSASSKTKYKVSSVISNHSDKHKD
ncbi:MAG: hypothetical protein LBS17_03100 [Actinomycetes bacterium]|jgi:hypothetical protein|nr:hypothetical protein [Actinomycetes bacterium]